PESSPASTAPSMTFPASPSPLAMESDERPPPPSRTPPRSPSKLDVSRQAGMRIASTTKTDRRCQFQGLMRDGGASRRRHKSLATEVRPIEQRRPLEAHPALYPSDLFEEHRKRIPTEDRVLLLFQIPPKGGVFVGR